MLLNGKTTKGKKIYDKIISDCLGDELHPEIDDIDPAPAHKVVLFYKFLAEVSPKTKFTISPDKALYIYSIHHGLEHFGRLLT